MTAISSRVLIQDDNGVNSHGRVISYVYMDRFDVRRLCEWLMRVIRNITDA